MKSSFLSKVALMEVAYPACLTPDPQKRSDLLNGIWWIADCLEEEIKENKIPNLTHALAQTSIIKDMAEEPLKNPNSSLKLEGFREACEKLWGDDPKWADPDSETSSPE